MSESETTQTPGPDRPYKRWDYFETKDHPIFFGRALETRLLFSEILSSRLVLLYAKSGTGKTSLINAGVRPLLEAHNFHTFIIRMGDDPLEAIKSGTASLNPNAYESMRREPLSKYFKRMLEDHTDSIVLFLDQFEEFFIHLTDDVQEEFVSQVAELYHERDLPIFLVFSLREDFFVEMDRFRAHIPSIFENNSNLRLRWFKMTAAKEAIEEPAKIFDRQFSKALVRTLLKELKRDGKGIEPIRLQLVCDALWDATSKDERKIIKLADYRKLGSVAAIEEAAFADALEAATSVDQENLLPALLRMLITEAGTKNYVEQGALLEQLKVAPHALEDVMKSLQDKRLIRASRKENETFYELSHDYLVPQVKKWLSRKGFSPTDAQNRAAELANIWKVNRQPIDQEPFNYIDKQRALLELDQVETEMLAQAAIYYNQNVKFWFDRLANEAKALALVKELEESRLRVASSSLISALGLLRSSDATREMVRIAVKGQATYWFGDKAEIAELARRPDAAALYELYSIAGSTDQPKGFRSAAVKYLAALRARGSKLPSNWSRSDIYGVMAWLTDYGFYDNSLVGPPKLLGHVLTHYEDARGRTGHLRAWTELLLVALSVGLYRGLLGALIGAIAGPLVGLLYALFNNLWQMFAHFKESGQFIVKQLSSGYWSPLVEGFKFGIFLGWVVAFVYLAGLVLGRGRKAMKKLRQKSDGEKSVA